jgi:uncharacterized protein (DUF433 family)
MSRLRYDVSEVIMSVATGHRYIVRDPEILSNEPIIQGTRTPVRAIVEPWRLGVVPEEIATHLPHLTTAQVFDALSYYSDNQAEIHAHIERNRVPDYATPVCRPRKGSTRATYTHASTSMKT